MTCSPTDVPDGRYVRRLVPIAVCAGTLAVGALYVSDSTGVGADAFTGLAVASTIATGVFSWRRRPAVRWPWACLTTSMVFFLVGIALRSFTARPGPSGIQPTGAADIWTVAGYACLAAFMYGLIPAHSRNDWAVTLDAASVMTSGGLLTWAVLVNPAFSVPGTTEWDRLSVTSSPVADMFLCFLLSRVYLTRRTMPRSLRWIMLGFISLLIGDTGYAMHAARLLNTVSDAYLSVWFLIGFASLALASIDWSMVELTAETPETEPVRDGPWRNAIILISMVTPILVILLWPHSTSTELWVGGTLTLSQTLVTFARLMVSLSRIRAQESAAWRFARVHPLTRLTNQSRVMELLSDSYRRGQRPAVAEMTLLNHGALNATWGPHVGDALLQQVARRLADLLKAGGVEDAVLAHTGTDTFAAVLENGGDIRSVASSMLAAFDEDFPVPGVGDLSISAGVATSDVGHDADSLWRSVSLAARQARADQVVIYTEEMTQAATRRISIAQALRAATARKEFTPYYQPLFSTHGQRLIGYETLMRWTSPTLGWVSPGEFIPIAEETGAIVEMGTWILREACQQTARWRAEPGRGTLHVSVNLAPAQLASPDVVSVVDGILRDTGLPPHALWLEVTETDLMTDPKAAAGRLENLRQLGVTLAVDDFGTGYSSLEYLSTFPVDVLKIDRAFVTGLGSPCRESAIAEAVTSLAHTMGMTVVAEGVETHVQLHALERMGVEVLQGFLLGKPAPAADAARESLLDPEAGQCSAALTVPLPAPR